MTTVLPGVGHNAPPLEPLSEVLSEVRVNLMLAAELQPLEERAEVLAESCARFVAAIPVITTEEQDEKATEIMAVCQRFTAKNGRVDAARVAFKAPVLAAQKAIDTSFPAVAGIVSAAVAPIAAASTQYKVQKEAKVRAAREAEAARLREEALKAEQAAEAARQAQSAEKFAAAQVAWEAAEKAQAAAQAKPADLTRTRGQDFGQSGLTYDRVVTIEAPHLVPAQYCVPSPELLKHAAGKPGSAIPVIPGVKIVDVPKMRVGR